MTPAAISIDAITLRTTGICSVVRVGMVGADFFLLSLKSLYMFWSDFFSEASTLALAVTFTFAGESFCPAEDSAFL